jgi:hypothetical protein
MVYGGYRVIVGHHKKWDDVREGESEDREHEIGSSAFH